MISLEKWMIVTPLQKLPNNVGDLGKIVVVTGLEWLPKVQKSPNLVTLSGRRWTDKVLRAANSWNVILMFGKSGRPATNLAKIEFLFYGQSNKTK